MAMSDVELVRLNITDLATDPAQRLFTDDQLQGWLDANNGSVNRATYRALITIAASEVLVSKKIRTQDLTTDGPAVSAELRALAATYKADADAEDEADGSFFEVIPFGYAGKPEAAEWRLP